MLEWQDVDGKRLIVNIYRSKRNVYVKIPTVQLRILRNYFRSSFGHCITPSNIYHSPFFFSSIKTRYYCRYIITVFLLVFTLRQVILLLRTTYRITNVENNGMAKQKQINSRCRLLKAAGEYFSSCPLQ